MKSIRSQLSLTILFLVLITVGLVGLFSNVFINKAFTHYLTQQGKVRTKDIVLDIERYYDSFTNSWNRENLHLIGMYSMYEGYLVKILDKDGAVIWDAENHDCWRVMEEITKDMKNRGMNKQYFVDTYDMKGEGDQKIGSVSVTYYGPNFLSEADYSFIHDLNKILLIIGMISGFFSIVVGTVLAGRIARPVGKTARIATQISKGDYEIRFERNTNTRELYELTTAINDLADALNEQDKQRRRMTTDIAHELRTPLTAVSAHLEAMIIGIWEANPERLKGCYDEVKRLESLVADLGKLAKIEDENLKLNKTTADLLCISQTVFENMRAEADKKHLSVSVSGNPVFVEIDKDRIHQVITNLLSNAVKYTQEGGTIRLEVEESERYGIVKITDTGIGIAEAELPFIFERFYRTENSRNRKSGGAGIGLTIAKSIITAHDGELDAKSQVGAGSCFVIKIPKN